jgi:soluble P-type ATPase
MKAKAQFAGAGSQIEGRSLMSVVAYKEVIDMASYRENLPQTVNPLEQLYKLERDLKIAERRTASMIEELAHRMDLPDTRVSSVSERLDSVNRRLEIDIDALAGRVNAIENDRAA